MSEGYPGPDAMTTESRGVFVSTYLYSTRKAVGAANWKAFVDHELQHIGETRIPALQCIAEAGRLGEPLEVAIDAAGSVSQARSSMAGLFLDHGASDVWVSVDDDNYAGRDVLERMIAACRATRGVVAVPYWLRQEIQRLSFACKVDPTRADVAGIPLLFAPALRVGMGMIAIHRSAVERVAADVEWFGAELGKRRSPALFLEMIRDATWIGEDFSFSIRCHEAGVPIHLLPDAYCYHDGTGCKVSAAEDGSLAVVRAMHPTPERPSTPSDATPE